MIKTRHLIGLTIALLVSAISFAAQTSTSPQTQPKAAENSREYVVLTTSKGDIVLELDREKAPISVANFLSYTDKKFYDGTIFHRVIPGFMIQGGGFTSDMQQKPTDAPIKNEWQNGLSNTRGTIAMARLGDRKPNPSTVDSATAQFFINVVDNPNLDRPQPDGGAYAVFGRVIAGMEVVDQIRAVPTTTKPPHANVPVEPVVITKATRISEDEAKRRTQDQKPS